MLSVLCQGQTAKQSAAVADTGQLKQLATAQWWYPNGSVARDGHTRINKMAAPQLAGKWLGLPASKENIQTSLKVTTSPQRLPCPRLRSFRVSKSYAVASLVAAWVSAG